MKHTVYTLSGTRGPGEGNFTRAFGTKAGLLERMKSILRRDLFIKAPATSPDAFTREQGAWIERKMREGDIEAAFACFVRGMNNLPTALTTAFYWWEGHEIEIPDPPQP